MSINAEQLAPLVEAIYQLLVNHTEEPEDGMVVLANVFAFMYIRNGDGSITLEAILNKLTDRVTTVVTANVALIEKDTLQ